MFWKIKEKDMEIYLDHAATTWAYPSVADKVKEVMCTEFGNPSSMHNKGIEAERIVKDSAKTIAAILKANEKEIYFTSGGTESNNWALIGAAEASKRKGKRIITSKIEHASVSSPLSYLSKLGYEIVTIGTDKNGYVRLDALEEAINDDTILVSVMMVNNEIGTVQPIKEISDIIKKKKSDIIFHVDAIQAFGKFKIIPKQMGIDMLSVSGHKIHGPKGTGFLYISDKIRILPLIYGGGQQNGMRSGTDNVPGIAGLAIAAKKMYDNLAENTENMRRVKEHFIEGLKDIDKAVVNGDISDKTSPHILNVSFVGIRSEVMLHTLEDRGVYVSSGSACSSHKRHASDTLTAIGCDKARIEASVRFSFCETTTLEEIDTVLLTLKEIVPMLARYTRH